MQCCSELDAPHLADGELLETKFTVLSPECQADPIFESGTAINEALVVASIGSGGGAVRWSKAENARDLLNEAQLLRF